MKYYKANDNELVYLVCENEEYAQDILFRKYEPIASSLAGEYYRKAHGTGVEFDDLKQEAFVGLHRAMYRFQEQKGVLFYTFAVVCMERQIQTYLRSMMTRRSEILNTAISYDNVAEDSEYYGFEGIFSDAKQDLDHIYHVDELLEQVYLKALDMPLQRRCVFLLRIQGFRMGEISKLLDVSGGIVRSELSSAMRFIHGYFDDKLEYLL